MMMLMKRAAHLCAAAAMMASAALLAGIPAGQAAMISGDNYGCYSRMTASELMLYLVVDGPDHFTLKFMPHMESGQCRLFEYGTMGEVVREGPDDWVCFKPDGESRCLWVVGQQIVN